MILSNYSKGIIELITCMRPLKGMSRTRHAVGINCSLIAFRAQIIKKISLFYNACRKERHVCNTQDECFSIFNMNQVFVVVYGIQKGAATQLNQISTNTFRTETMTDAIQYLLGGGGGGRVVHRKSY